MKILQINKFHYIEGGTEVYYFKLSKLLEENEHKVAFFSMYDDKNFKTKWSRYFVSNASFRKIDLKNAVGNFFRMVYSFEAKNKINKLLDDFHPEIAHIHSIYNHISPSILPEIKKRRIPIVVTIHDYYLLSPNRILFHNGKICEITKPNKYYKALFHRCVKDSYFATFASIATLYIHKILGLYEKYVDFYITPSGYARNLFIDYGYDPKKVIHVPHFVEPKKYQGERKEEKEKYILYFGRLYEEKGLEMLLDVVKRLPMVKLKILGEGPLKGKLKKLILENNMKNVDLEGFKSGKELEDIIKNSYFTILPSIWYENYPNSILESFSYSKPVIASNIGGIPELVKNDVTGFLFKPGDKSDCQEKMLNLWNNSQKVKKMGENARKYIMKNNNIDDHYRKIIEVYQKAIRKN